MCSWFHEQTKNGIYFLKTQTEYLKTCLHYIMGEIFVIHVLKLDVCLQFATNQ